MKAKMTLFILLLAASSAIAETHVSIGVHVGGGYGYYPPPPPPVYVYEPACPGPDYVWVPGYWYGIGPRYSWRAGYWAAPGYARWYRSPGYSGYGSWRGGYRTPARYRANDVRYWGRGSEGHGRRFSQRGYRRYGSFPPRSGRAWPEAGMQGPGKTARRKYGGC